LEKDMRKKTLQKQGKIPILDKIKVYLTLDF
jgi:hypothetical protein